LTCGNASNERLTQILGACWPAIVTLLGNREPLVEVRDELSR
jgi:hypothetical protein